MNAISQSPTDIMEQPLSLDELRKTDAYWRACNYCCVGMLYLRANPLLREPQKKRASEPAAGTLGFGPEPERLRGCI